MGPQGLYLWEGRNKWMGGWVLREEGRWGGLTTSLAGRKNTSDDV